MRSIDDIKKMVIKRNDYGTRQKLYVFLICLVISALIWFIIKLSDRYEMVYSFPVVYKNIPSNVVTVNAPDSVLHLAFEAGGFEMISYSISTPELLNIDLNKLQLRKKNNTYEAFLLTKKLYSELSSQLKRSTKVKSISPDTLFFNYEKVERKKVPVVADVEIDLEKQYQISGNLLFSPDSVYVSGIAEELNNISAIYSEKKTFNALSVNIDKKLTLLYPKTHTKLRIDPEIITIKATVEKYTEAEIVIPVESKDNQLKLFPGKVTITYNVALKDYKDIKPEQFMAIVSLPKNVNNQKKLKVQIVNKPELVTISHINPKKVEFIILKK